MALLNVVRNSQGVAVAGFLSSIDARHYAEREAGTGYSLFVTDYAGFVTEHRRDEPVRIVEEGESAEARTNITDNFNVAEQVPA